MYRNVFVVLWSGLAAGLLGVIIVSLRLSRSEAMKLWLKFVVYVLIVHVTILAIAFGPEFTWPMIAGMVATAGLFEMVNLHHKVGSSSRGVFVTSLVFYMAVACGFVVFAATVETGLQLFVYLTVTVFDGFSQVFGQLLGKTKLAPTVSPGKTVEGSLGGLLTAGLMAAVMAGIAGTHTGGAVILAMVICTAGLAGDLSASLCKRLYKVKDYSRLIPGHGGILDRFDSFLMAGAVLVLLKAGQNVDALQSTASAALMVIGLLVAVELIYRSGHCAAETSRKCSHVGAMMIVLLLPRLGIGMMQIIVLGVLFTVLLASGKRLNFFKAIHSVGRTKSIGSYSFPAAMCICYLAFSFHGDLLWLYLPALILGISDSAAAIVGSAFPLGRYRIFGQTKSLAGSMAFLVTSFAIALVSIRMMGNPVWDLNDCLLAALSVTAATTVAEAVGVFGTDNLLIPVSALAVLFLLPG